MSGDIRSLEERYLLLFYYGGNKNLAEFIQRYYPLLDKMSKNGMYATKAMEYYRQLLIAKAYNQQVPYMPRKLEGYNSIFQVKNSYSPSKINENEENSRNNGEKMEAEEPTIDLYKSCSFSNGVFGAKDNKKIKNEPAVLNNRKREKENSEDEDVEMKDDTSKKSEDSTYEDVEGISGKENKNENIEYENNNKNKENKSKNDKNANCRPLTINQIGDLSMYPDAKEIDEMD